MKKDIDIEWTLAILKCHNIWCRGADTKMLDPKDIGIAIDFAIYLLEQLNEQSAKKK